MATKEWYLEEVVVTGTTRRIFWDEDIGAAPVETTSTTGWVVGKTNAGNYRIMVNGSEISGGFSSTLQPDNTAAPISDENWPSTAVFTPPTLINAADCISTLYEYNGVFPAGTWTFEFPLRAVTTGGTQDGRVRMRVYKAQRTSGGNGWQNITELTSATLLGTVVTNLATTTTQTSTVTWSAPDITLNNEFLLCQIAWHITGGGGGNNADVLFRYGTTARMTSPEFRKRSYNIN